MHSVHPPQAIHPWARRTSTRRPNPRDALPTHRRRCRDGRSCIYFAMGQCWFLHSDTLPAHLESISQGLADPAVIPAFRDVDTAFQWYGIRNVRMLASFNYLRDERVAVPGLFPRLCRPTTYLHYKKKDPNTRPADSPSSPSLTPFGPLTRALTLLSPSVPLSSLDYVTTAGCLHRLTGFLRSQPRAERLDLEFRSGTLFMHRWQADPRLHKHVGFGSQFEEDTRRFEADGPLGESLSSHAVVVYEIGGLKLGVQIEVDSYECECHAPGRSPPAAAAAAVAPPSSGERAGRRVSGNRFDVLSLDDGSGGENDSPFQEAAGEWVVRAGTKIPLACAVEVKTCKADDAHDRPWLQQLYFQQTPRVFVAIHESGRFQTRQMELRDERERLVVWEAENQVHLARLVALLKDVRAEAQRRVEGEGECKMALMLKVGKAKKARDPKKERDWEAVLYRRDGEGMVSEV